ncbi:MAG: cytochrome P450 [Cyanobacteria bacterium SW_9_44_58]|uniref:Cytochrome P450 CYP120A4 n=1 Tax=Cyanobacteriota bacterium SW-94458 TaxID=3071953 RepID=A0AA51GHL4_9CYAN|nr:MAG: cytochrome P450 [Cyanobacteria bacterium SW_9_44_58]WMI51985.1 cytochrome P450 CYP120A4 [Cyanobacteriota bacterium SW-94458]
MTTQTATTQSLPPGNFGLPFIGETIAFLRDKDFVNKRNEKYGSVFKTRLFGKPTIVFKGEKATQFILTNENKYFTSSWPRSIRILLGPLSLTIQTGHEHKQRRKLLAQAFKPRALSSYIETMEEITQKFLTSWEKQQYLSWYPQLRNYTFDIAFQLFVGLENGSQTQLRHLFETWSNGLFSIPISLPWTKFGRALNCRNKILNQLDQIIKERQNRSDPGNDALGTLMKAEDEEGNKLSVDELKDQILLLLFAGHETLTSGLTSFCMLMAQHPEILQKVREEQEQFSTSEPVTLESLKQMTYLEQILQEVLRLIPPVGGVFREVTEDCEFNGYFIPKGWNVLCQINQTHQEETVYPKPQTYNPERFNPEQPYNPGKTYNYIPFGGGMRECLGKEFARLEMKLFAAHLVRNYQWELVPNQDTELTTVPVPRPRDGLKVKFEKIR